VHKFLACAAPLTAKASLGICPFKMKRVSCYHREREFRGANGANWAPGTIFFPHRDMPTTSQESVSLITELDKLASSAPGAEALMNSIVKLLHGKLTRYNWVGFYMNDPSDPNMLVLGPFRGSMTPHTRIPLNQGICSAAASSGKTVVVDDVNSDPRYLACSLETKSEIVLPVFAKGKVVGELDIDSHFPAAFGPDDRNLCERAGALLGKFIETHG
jgi:L-methionine (R)-S-oxide reductase